MTVETREYIAGRMKRNAIATYLLAQIELSVHANNDMLETYYVNAATDYDTICSYINDNNKGNDMDNKQRIAEAATQFPAHFGLRAFPEMIFTINQQYSYIDDDNSICLVIDVVKGGKTDNFSKCSVAELGCQFC